MVLILLFLLFTALILGAVGFFNHRFNLQIEKALAEGADVASAKAGLLDQKKGFLRFFSQDNTLVDAMAELPLVLLVTYWLCAWFLPFFVALMGFDQLSGELGPKSIRFLVVRVERRSILFGKLLTQATLLFGVLTIATLMMVAVGGFLDSDFTSAMIAKWTLKLLLSWLAIGLSWLALTSMCSALFRQPGVSLVVNVILVFALAFISLFGGFFRFPGEAALNALDTMVRGESWAAALRYVSIWSFSRDLLHPAASRIAAALLVHLGYAALFLGLGERSLARKDV